jgi:hypothetical protein
MLEAGIFPVDQSPHGGISKRAIPLAQEQFHVGKEWLTRLPMFRIPHFGRRYDEP